MKTKYIAPIIAISTSLSAYAQTGGDLTPPAGAPGKTMKSLDQMEPRTPLVEGAAGVSIAASGTISISQSGSYYLTENLSVTSGDGITINAGGVTLDLRGFSITSTADTAGSEAIDINGSRIFIFNGHITSGTSYDSGSGTFSGSGFQYGIYASSSVYKRIRIRDISIQGCSTYGIYCADYDTSQVHSCTVDSCGSIGIRAGIVSYCNVNDCGATGISARTVSHCRSKTINGSAISGTTVSHSYGIANGSGNGISASTVTNSYGFADTSGTTGIDAVYSVSNSYGQTNGSGDGIEASTVTNSYGFASFGTTGIDAFISVFNSYGQTNGSGDGIEANIISYSHGRKFEAGAGFGLECTIGVGCTSVGGQSITNKYLMP